MQAELSNSLAERRCRQKERSVIQRPCLTDKNSEDE